MLAQSRPPSGAKWRMRIPHTGPWGDVEITPGDQAIGYGAAGEIVSSSFCLPVLLLGTPSKV